MPIRGVVGLIITVGITALVWVAVQDWYESRRKSGLAAVIAAAPAGPGQPLTEAA
jgi:predicted PurR-regulated permease PerM